MRVLRREASLIWPASSKIAKIMHFLGMPHTPPVYDAESDDELLQAEPARGFRRATFTGHVLFGAWQRMGERPRKHHPRPRPATLP